MGKHTHPHCFSKASRTGDQCNFRRLSFFFFFDQSAFIYVVVVIFPDFFEVGYSYREIELIVHWLHCTIFCWYSAVCIRTSSSGFVIYPISTIVTGTWLQLFPLIVSVSHTYSLLQPVTSQYLSRIASDNALLSSSFRKVVSAMHFLNFSNYWPIRNT